MDPGGPPLGPPTEGEPAWLPDPTRRHELRWFDGKVFTDQVADRSFRSTDAGGPFGVTSGPTSPTAGSGASEPPRRGGRVPLVLAGVGIGAVLGGAAYLLVGDDDAGFGAFEGTVGDEDGEHEISLSGGSVAIVRLEPAPGFDAIVGFRLHEDDTARIEDLYVRTPYALEATARDDQVFRFDTGFEGQEELTFLAAPFGVDATVVVTGFAGSEGDYVIDIGQIRLDDIDGDADGDDLLEALAATNELPLALRDDIESRLEE